MRKANKQQKVFRMKSHQGSLRQKTPGGPYYYRVTISKGGPRKEFPLKTNDLEASYKDKGKHVSGYAELVAELLEKYPLGTPIVGETAQKAFIRLYGTILKVKNILSAFDAFPGNEILSPPRFSGLSQHLH
jgi:hypothetical protein